MVEIEPAWEILKEESKEMLFMRVLVWEGRDLEWVYRNSS